MSEQVRLWWLYWRLRWKGWKLERAIRKYGQFSKEEWAELNEALKRGDLQI